MNIDEYIKKAIIIFENARPATDYQTLINILKGENIPSNIASYLVFFLPAAFTRIICRDFNISFTNIYIEYFDDGEIDQGLLSENRIYNAVLEYSFNFISNSPKKELVFKIASTSPEFEIINTCLLKKIDPSKISFSPLKIIF